MKNELSEIMRLVADIQRRQQEMEIEIVTLGDRLGRSVERMLKHPDLTDKMKIELQELVASMQFAILELQGKEVH